MKRKGTQFEALNLAGLHPSLGGSQVPAVITGRVARHVMERADIVQTKADAPHINDYYGREMDRGYPYGTVHTSQGHLHVPTLNQYAAGNIPEWDPNYDIDEEDSYNVPYDPETYEYDNKTWLAEGHHRTVATRLGQR